MKVEDLGKYLKHFNLSFRGKKDDKVRRILAHVCNVGGILKGLDTYIASRKEPKELFTSAERVNQVHGTAESDSEVDLVICPS